MTTTTAPIKKRLKDFNTLTFHPVTEKIVKILSEKTENGNLTFFRIIVNYYIAKMAAMMRASVITEAYGSIPINAYAINLAPSGQGKNHSASIIEKSIMNHFNYAYESTKSVITDSNLNEMAVDLYNEDVHIISEEAAYKRVETDFKNCGEIPDSFNSGTTAAIAQTRIAMLIAKIGSVNLEMDEIGSNLLGNSDLLGALVELYDMGETKNKLIKNSRDNVRIKDVKGQTPTNLLLFGTDSKLLDGSRTEDEFISFLDMGYARRSIFGFSTEILKKKISPEERYDKLTDTTLITDAENISRQFGMLAGSTNYAVKIIVEKEEALLLIEYRQYCEELADEMPEHQNIEKTEMRHRWNKTLKLAGAYAFIDGQPVVSSDNIHAAICLVEDSGKSLNRILNRDRPYVKIAKYLAGGPNDITQVELAADVPCYKGSIGHKKDLITMCIAWAHKNHIVIKVEVRNGIEFFSGEKLQTTNLDEIYVSHSKDMTTGYQNVKVKFEDMYKLTQQKDTHWLNHHLNRGRREENEIVTGCDVIVLDIDDGIPIEGVKAVFKEYKYLLHTTKSHTEQHHKFRVILPLNYKLHLNADDYKEFMENIFDILPFKTDAATRYRSKKWLTHSGKYHYGKGEKLIDVLSFIPRTAKNDERKRMKLDHKSLENLERWFMLQTVEGNRNENLLRYALALVDAGKATLKRIKEKIMVLNNKLPQKLTEEEIDKTIMVTVKKRMGVK